MSDLDDEEELMLPCCQCFGDVWAHEPYRDLDGPWCDKCWDAKTDFDHCPSCYETETLYKDEWDRWACSGCFWHK